MTASEIASLLEPLGTESYRKTLFRHGIQEPVFGVKIEELKKIQKRVKKDYQLALDLYATGVYDLQYLAGLIGDETKMTKKDLRRWLATANCVPMCGTAVAWVAAESKHGRELGLEWIESKKEATAQTGWTILASLLAISDDADLDLAETKELIVRIRRTIHDQPNRVRYMMNGFLISAGIYVPELTAFVTETAEEIGKVKVDMGDTSCKVPYAPDYIQKAEQCGVIGRKRKTIRC